MDILSLLMNFYVFNPYNYPQILIKLSINLLLNRWVSFSKIECNTPSCSLKNCIF